MGYHKKLLEHVRKYFMVDAGIAEKKIKEEVQYEAGRPTHFVLTQPK
jgi:hypothetical protein